MLNLSKSALIFIAKKRSVSVYKNMSKDELIDAINISEKEEIKKKNTFKQKREEVQRSLIKPLRKNIFKSKRKEIKKESYETLKEEDP